MRRGESSDKDVDEEGRGVTVRLLDPFATRLTVLVDMPRRGRDFALDGGRASKTMKLVSNMYPSKRVAV